MKTKVFSLLFIILSFAQLQAQNCDFQAENSYTVTTSNPDVPGSIQDIAQQINQWDQGYPVEIFFDLQDGSYPFFQNYNALIDTDVIFHGIDQSSGMEVEFLDPLVTNGRVCINGGIFYDNGPITTYVSNTSDAGYGSLRQAIEDVNSQGGFASTNNIFFNIPGQGPHLISLASALPEITKSVIIDGTTQPLHGYTGAEPIIKINGENIIVSNQQNSYREHGFVFSSHKFGLKGLSLSGFSDAIQINSGTSINITNNIITDNYEGINLLKGENITISQNVISGNNMGLQIGPNCNKTTITNNKIGVDITGSFAYPNNDGIQALGSNTIIGGLISSEGNVISGNSSIGIWLADGNTKVYGNLIGTDITGQIAIPNQWGIYGISEDCEIGSLNPLHRNIISGNTKGFNSIINNSFSVQNNYIGTNLEGTLPIANGVGIDFWLKNNQPTHGIISHNLISGNNTGMRIDISDEYDAASTLTISDNTIGLNEQKNAILKNITGVRITSWLRVTHKEIPVTLSNNVIAGNRSGVYLQSASAVIMESNYIGTNDANFSNDFGNEKAGIAISSSYPGGNTQHGSFNNTIGTALAKNYIGYNKTGISIYARHQEAPYGNNYIHNEFYQNDSLGITFDHDSFTGLQGDIQKPTFNTYQNNTLTGQGLAGAKVYIYVRDTIATYSQGRTLLTPNGVAIDQNGDWTYQTSYSPCKLTAIQKDNLNNCSQFADSCLQAINTSPVVISTIPKQENCQDFSSYTIDLKLIFSDNETASSDLIYSISGNTNIQTSILNGIATISVTPIWHGSETLTFKAKDSQGAFIETSVDFEVKQSFQTTINETICFGDSYTFEGDVLTQSNQYIKTLTAQNNCDSVVTVNLTVSPMLSSSTTAQINEGENYIFGSQTLTLANTYTETFTSTVTGCDSTVSLTLTVIPNTSPYLVKTLATQNLQDNFTAYTIDLKQFFDDNETTVTDLIYSISGNTNIQTAITNGVVTISSNPNWVGTESLTFRATDTHGKFVETTTKFEVKQSFQTTVNETICFGDSYNFEGDLLTESKQYTKTLISVNNTDSVVTINLTVRPAISSSITIQLNEGENYIFGSQTLTVANTYTETFTSTVTGCDSTVNLTLTVKPNTSPYVENEITTQILEANFTDYTIDLTQVFNDNESTTLIYTVSDNTDLNISLKNGIATISTTPNWTGTTSIIFTAEDESGATTTEEVFFEVSPVAGIAEVLEKQTIVYPNPTSGAFTIECPIDIKQIIIYSANGEKIKTIQSKNYQIEHLPIGLYIIEIHSNNTIIRKQLIKE